MDVINRLTWAHENPGRHYLETSILWGAWLHYCTTGDFHFLWECLRVIFLTFWSTPAKHGSLCNTREQLRRTQVDKGVKVFSVGDEFLVHTFKGHLAARICTILGLKSTSDAIPHERSHMATVYGWCLHTLPAVTQSTASTGHSFIKPSYTWS